MRRREFIALVGGLLTWPRVARARQTERMRRLAILMPFPETDFEAPRWLTAFKEGLRQSTEAIVAMLRAGARQDIAFTQREWSSDAALACWTTRRQRRHWNVNVIGSAG